MTGIDYFSAMMIASEIGDMTRFSTPEKLVSWSGLCPSIRQSGNSLYMGRMKYGILVWIVSIDTPIRKFSLHGKDEGWKQEGKMDTNSGSKHSSKKRR